MAKHAIIKSGIALAASLMLAPTAFANSGTILQGVLDVPRSVHTAPTDGCAKVQKGLINSGGFLLFTCEKLRPELPISLHETAFRDYQSALRRDGWQSKSNGAEKAEYKKVDAFGCETHLDMTLWKDRSMNEPKRAATDREAHRQIVFMARFYGPACERHYPTAQALADARP